MTESFLWVRDKRGLIPGGGGLCSPFSQTPAPIWEPSLPEKAAKLKREWGPIHLWNEMEDRLLCVFRMGLGSFRNLFS